MPRKPKDLEYHRNCSNEELLQIKAELRRQVTSQLVEITNENITDYYEFMSDEEKMSHAIELDEIFSQRQTDIMFNIVPANEEDYLEVKSIKGSELPQYDSTIHLYDLTYEQNIFGVKDTLKPIDEYIQDIKASVLYQEYKNTKPVDLNVLFEDNIWEDDNAVRALDEITYSKFTENLTDFNYHTEKVLMDAIRTNNQDIISSAKKIYQSQQKNHYLDVETCKERSALIQKIEDFNSKNTQNPTPTIDECLQQIEEEETAKQKVKSPRL